MTKEQLIAEIEALPQEDRRQVAEAILSSKQPWQDNGSHRKAGKISFAERWSGKFTLPDPKPDDARLTYLLERFSH